MAKGKVLVIDDEELVCKSLRVMLKEHDYEASSAVTGEEGVKLAGEGNFDVILLDLKMPDIDGIEILKKIKGDDPKAVVIIITGYPSEETLGQARSLGAYDYITKPFDVMHLSSLVEKGVGHRKLLLSTD